MVEVVVVVVLVVVGGGKGVEWRLTILTKNS